MNRTNCLLFAISYYLTNKGCRIKADWDKTLGFYHFYIIHGDFEIHCEQKHKNDNWSFLFEPEIIKIRLRNRNKRK